MGVSVDFVDTGDLKKRVLKTSQDEYSPGSTTFRRGPQIPLENS